MNLTIDCPHCGDRITSKRRGEEDWFYCANCQSLFFSCESLRKNWPSLYKTLAKRKEDFPRLARHTV